ncbi:GNAT family N-acetyltransferase [Streptomyces somaliensis DSM 40738]|uniref:GNAT family N-acetyltransferase n=1 Tax=Streptomyces somaliensis (strain ATCC 33201 / DSM 40738 / JCM 12659 / KCTC 9044 / NCTC 11332 / NRRL B-12077 / IP 733) TaxID=1134445 RepID=A0AA44IEE0_STRE0|nr:GNAT family N-acetyltransferase [Streptomyces somaliensis]MCQ0023718.1 GNAT family N-acetyltransferase [Streptomyces somaliensis DSM 40738]NKY15670.1 GNAT family N-acetyltransferase [Streptomyces somaliensis DSM 40738]
MQNADITAAWVRGWAVSRGTPPPVEEPWGYRIDVGLGRHVLRHVVPEPDGPTVRRLCETVTRPYAWLKVLAEPEEVAGWITPGWTVPDDPGFMMHTVLRPAPAPEPPAGYTRHIEVHEGVHLVRVLAGDGSLAARGQVAPTGRTAVFDQIETYEGHRRRGLGSTVMRLLHSAAAAAGATTGVLAATVDGFALYTSLGWRYQGPLTGVVRDGGPSADGAGG